MRLTERESAYIFTRLDKKGMHLVIKHKRRLNKNIVNTDLYELIDYIKDKNDETE